MVSGFILSGIAGVVKGVWICLGRCSTQRGPRWGERNAGLSLRAFVPPERDIRAGHATHCSPWRIRPDRTRPGSRRCRRSAGLRSGWSARGGWRRGSDGIGAAGPYYIWWYSRLEPPNTGHSGMKCSMGCGASGVAGGRCDRPSCAACIRWLPRRRATASVWCPEACSIAVGGYSAGFGVEFDIGRRDGEVADESGMLFSG